MIERTFSSPYVDIAHLLVPVLWFGLLVGVCFVAVPVKFAAPSLSLPVALDVGRVTFALFNDIEWVMLALTVIVVVFSGPRALPAMATAFLALILCVQTAWFLPALDARVTMIMAGGVPSPSSYHLYYIAADVLKAGVLLAMAWAQASQLAHALAPARHGRRHSMAPSVMPGQHS
jgi:hypothetical protein